MPILLFLLPFSYTQAQELQTGSPELVAQASRQVNKVKDDQEQWEKVFFDEFNTNGSFDLKKWKFESRGNVPWKKFLTPSAEYAHTNGTDLILKMDDAKIDGDDAPYHSGGINTSGKFSIKYGKIEVRAKFNSGKGSWPAIWMMPENPNQYGGWPKSGEIDIMEHVNMENVIHHTIHNKSVTDENGGSTATKAVIYNVNDYNTYSIIWTPEAIEFFVNDKFEYKYEKEANATSAQWPFDQPFYLILNQSGGIGWPGPLKTSDLPFEMKVDWVRVYKMKGS